MKTHRHHILPRHMWIDGFDGDTPEKKARRIALGRATRAARRYAQDLKKAGLTAEQVETAAAGVL